MTAPPAEAYDYAVVKLHDLETLWADGWRACGYDPRYLPAFGSLWVRRKVTVDTEKRRPTLDSRTRVEQISAHETTRS